MPSVKGILEEFSRKTFSRPNGQTIIVNRKKAVQKTMLEILLQLLVRFGAISDEGPLKLAAGIEIIKSIIYIEIVILWFDRMPGIIPAN